MITFQKWKRNDQIICWKYIMSLVPRGKYYIINFENNFHKWWDSGNLTNNNPKSLKHENFPVLNWLEEIHHHRKASDMSEISLSYNR